MKSPSIVLLSIFLGSAIASVVKYNNYSLYRIIPRNVQDLNTVTSMQESMSYDFWTYPKGVGVPVDIMLAPEQKTNFEKILLTNEMEFSVVIKNIQENIDEETRINNLERVNSEFSWDKYHRLDDIYDWLRKLAADNPDTVTLLEGGTSYENRSILGVKVSFKPGTGRRGVWLDSLIHAREWISGATSTFILNEILHSDDPVVRSVAESHDWYFFPAINPDGYEYSHTNNRFWRKNRAPTPVDCVGIDLNRNWDFKWNLDGDASYECSDSYGGTGPFSEIESRSLAEFILSIGDDLLVFLTLHSYSQLFLIPYGDTAQHVENYNVTYPAGLKAAKVLSKRYGTKYEVGNTVEILYAAYGGSDDWTKLTSHVPFLYTIELRDNGKYGFVLPAEQIIPSGLETLDAVIALIQEADNHNLT